MSIIIAAKYNNGIIYASDTLTISGDEKFNGIKKIFKKENICIRTKGDTVDSNIIVYSTLDLYNSGDDFCMENIINKFLPKLVNLFDNKNRIIIENNIKKFNSQFIIGNNMNIYTIDMDGCVVEHDNFVCIGSGSAYAMGYLNTVNNIHTRDCKQIIKIINIAIKNACKSCLSTNDDVQTILLNKR